MLGAAIGGITAALGAATDAAKEFKNSIAAIGAVSESSAEQLAELGDGARQLARDIAFDLTEGMKALFDLIRSGVPRENAIDALRISAEAAKASLTSISVGAKASALLIDAFGFAGGN